VQCIAIPINVQLLVFTISCCAFGCSVIYSDKAEVSIAVVSIAVVSTAEVSKSEESPDEFDDRLESIAVVSTAEVSIAVVSIAEVSTAEVSTAEVSIAEVSKSSDLREEFGPGLDLCCLFGELRGDPDLLGELCGEQDLLDLDGELKGDPSRLVFRDPDLLEDGDFLSLFGDSMGDAGLLDRFLEDFLVCFGDRDLFILLGECIGDPDLDFLDRILGEWDLRLLVGGDSLGDLDLLFGGDFLGDLFLFFGELTGDSELLSGFSGDFGNSILLGDSVSDSDSDPGELGGVLGGVLGPELGGVWGPCLLDNLVWDVDLDLFL